MRPTAISYICMTKGGHKAAPGGGEHDELQPARLLLSGCEYDAAWDYVIHYYRFKQVSLADFSVVVM